MGDNLQRGQGWVQDRWVRHIVPVLHRLSFMQCEIGGTPCLPFHIIVFIPHGFKVCRWSQSMIVVVAWLSWLLLPVLASGQSSLTTWLFRSWQTWRRLHLDEWSSPQRRQTQVSKMFWQPSVEGSRIDRVLQGATLPRSRFPAFLPLYSGVHWWRADCQILVQGIPHAENPPKHL